MTLIVKLKLLSLDPKRVSTLLERIQGESESYRTGDGGALQVNNGPREARGGEIKLWGSPNGALRFQRLRARRPCSGPAD
jgi:hypothetical protein